MMRFVDAWRARRVQRLKPVRDDVLLALYAQYPFSLGPRAIARLLHRHPRYQVRRALAALQRDGFVAPVGRGRQVFQLTRTGLALPPRRPG
jgi:hypothetical protein